MNIEFLKIVNPGQFSSTTSTVIWSMIIFLFILLTSISIAVIRELNKNKPSKNIIPDNKQKGFK